MPDELKAFVFLIILVFALVIYTTIYSYWKIRQMAKKSFFIKKLDDGYTVESNNRVKAIQDTDSLKKYLLDEMEALIDVGRFTDINNALISIDVMPNCPTEQEPDRSE